MQREYFFEQLWPFAMVDTLLLSLELESVRLSTVEFTKLLTRRFRS